jgi:hypothetical protein
MSGGAMRSTSTPLATAPGPTTLLRRALACALALSLILGLLFMAAPDHAAAASPSGVAIATTLDGAPDLALNGETGTHCHCQTTVPATIEFALVRAANHRAFAVAHDRELTSAATDRLPEPPRV